MSQAPVQQHPDFTWLRTETIASLGLDVEEYEHNKTGAKHYHLKADNDENVFLVALRTMPTDSTGVAHILEHTALCGSEKYPVRDPFFMMIRRSLNTFMNAFTSSDWTAYPFASKNKKDFNNLLSVYLDAVFFAQLDEMDFLQEGHRIEFENPEDKNSELQFKGVVYNEMKGAMSSPVSQLWQAFTKYLYPTTTYHYNSGGDPESILDLSYEELKAFYAEHYHPSNAVFMTYGDIPASEHHEFFAPYLARFEKSDKHIHVEDEKRYHAPVRIQEAYGYQSEDGLEGHTHHVMGWLLGHGSDLDEQLEAHFLSNLLLENSSSPLRHALETTELGNAPSPLCGLEDSNKEMCFMCGVEGSDPEKVLEVEALIESTLKEVAENGVSSEQIESVLHQLELSQREVGGDSYPFGLQLILSALGAATHYGDPVGLLNIDPALVRLREKAQQPSFVKDLVEKHLLNNAHRVTLTLYPDEGVDERKANAEKEQLKKIHEALTETEIEQIVDQGTALKARQMQKDDESLLPKVTLDDVASELHVPSAEKAEVSSDVALSKYEQGTNGLVYHQVCMPLPDLNDEEKLLLPLVTNYMTEVGLGSDEYLATQHRQSLQVGGISAYSSVRSNLDDEQSTIAYWTLSGKALASKGDDFFALMQETLSSARFDEGNRLKDLVAQSRMRKEQAITGNGHSLAMSLASSGMSPAAKLAFEVGGLPSILRMRELQSSLADDHSLKAFGDQMSALYGKINKGVQDHLLISDGQNLQVMADKLSGIWQPSSAVSGAAYHLDSVSERINEAWVVPTQVSFCSRAFKTVPSDHADAPALAVLGGFLRNGFLHTAIREQGGAYGGGAGQDGGSASFRFYSYRDPRFEGTYEDFDRSIEWLQSNEHGYESLEQAILGVISSIDKPSSPAGEAKQAFHNLMVGRTPEWRNQFRQRVLAVTLNDLVGLADKYFTGEASNGALIPQSQVEAAKAMDMEIKEL